MVPCSVTCSLIIAGCSVSDCGRGWARLRRRVSRGVEVGGGVGGVVVGEVGGGGGGGGGGVVCFGGVWVGRVKDIGGALAAVLAEADVDHGQGEAGRLHDAARGVAEEEGGFAEQAPVGDGGKVDEEVGVGVGVAEGADAGHQGVAAGVGVGVAE